MVTSALDSHIRVWNGETGVLVKPIDAGPGNDIVVERGSGEYNVSHLGITVHRHERTKHFFHNSSIDLLYSFSLYLCVCCLITVETWSVATSIDGKKVATGSQNGTYTFK